MGLIERVRHDVQQREREQGQPTLEDHEAHLSHGRPRQRGFHGGLGQHDHAPEQGRETAGGDENREHAGGEKKDVGKSDEQNPPALITPAWSRAETGVGVSMTSMSQPWVGN